MALDLDLSTDPTKEMDKGSKGSEGSVGREDGRMMGIQLMCSISHDAGVAVGVVIANKVEIP